MMAIVLKDSTYKRVFSRMRYDGVLVDFCLLTFRRTVDCGFSYLYFRTFSDLCHASDFLSAYNAVYRVVETSL